MNPAISTGGRAAPRTSIYPHRSVRSLRLTRGRRWVSWGVAVLAFLLIGSFAAPLMALHSAMADRLLAWTGIPNAGWEEVAVFPGLEPGRAPLVPVPAFAQVTGGARLSLILGIVALLVMTGRYLLFRNLGNFLIVLLGVSALVNAAFDTFRLDARVFGQIWLRQELLVWMLMPFAGVLLFLLPQPRLRVGLAWLALAQAYGFLFSVLRFVFCLGMLHYTGLLFMPLLWFALGALSDLLYLLLFFSISVHQAAGHLWGGRDTWRLQL